MSPSLMAIAMLVVPVTMLLTMAARRLALSCGLIDRPNGRSSHVIPTPLGGGAAIVVFMSAILAWLFARGEIAPDAFAVLVGGGIAVALVGFIDDWRQLSTHVRLGVHVAAACWAMWWLQGLPPLQVGERLLVFGWMGYPLGVLGIVWSINLFNFMDGLDGIAASEGAFVAIVGAFALAVSGFFGGIPVASLLLGMACLGFLILNWPPAKIFLGDVGSGYLGHSLACIALLAARENPVAIWVFVILGAVFVVDATVTFIRRIARHERYDVGHRTHGYQRLSRQWRSHRRVTLAVTAANLAFLLPAALLAAHRPTWAAGITLFVLLGLTGAAIVVGSGKKETAG